MELEFIEGSDWTFRDADNAELWQADSDHGSYVIWDMGDEYVVRFIDDSSVILGRHSTLNAAKAACEAHAQEGA